MEQEMQKVLRSTRITTVLTLVVLAVVCVAAAVLIPRVSRALDHAEETLADVETLVETADGALSAANKALSSANAAADAANRLVTDNADTVSEAMEKFNSVDFETLNKAINDLATIVEPLARITSALNH